LVVEPLARGVTPWWGDWTRTFAIGGWADEWKFDVPLPRASPPSTKAPASAARP
jgi:hypothetical protein